MTSHMNLYWLASAGISFSSQTTRLRIPTWPLLDILRVRALNMAAHVTLEYI